MSKPIADEALDIQLALLVGEGTEQTPYDTKMLKKLIARHTAAAQRQLLTELLRLLPEKKPNLEGEPTYNLIQNATNGTIDQVVSIINHYLTKEEKS